MAFLRFCGSRGLIASVPELEKVDAEEVMKGRPVTEAEFQRMLDATPDVVGRDSAASWIFALKVLWESGFRVGEMMDFSWDDTRFIHPVWPKRLEHLPTIIIGSSQKNGRVQEIPMMPGLLQLLEQTPTAQRTGWIVNPAPLECLSRFREGAFRPSTSVLTRIAKKFSNLSIARACGVSEASVRNWLAEAAEIPERRFQINSELPEPVIQELRLSAEAQSSRENSSHGRMSVERVGRIICRIGKAADVVVQAADRRTGQRKKFASAHDIRRGCAQRLINLGVSAETLKVVMRHESFATTEKHYGAVRSAQSAAAEIAAKLRPSAKNSELVGGLVGGLTNGVGLNAEEINALKSLLQRL